MELADTERSDLHWLKRARRFLEVSLEETRDQGNYRSAKPQEAAEPTGSEKGERIYQESRILDPLSVESKLN